MRSTIFIATILAVLFCGVVAEVLVDQPITIQSQTPVSTPARVIATDQGIVESITEEELLQNNIAYNTPASTPVSADQAVLTPVAAPLLTPSVEKDVGTFDDTANTNLRVIDSAAVPAERELDSASKVVSVDQQAVATPSAEILRTSEGNFFVLERPAVRIGTPSSKIATTSSIVRPRIVQVVRESIDTQAATRSTFGGVVENRLFEVLQPTAPPTTEPVQIRPIRVTEPISSLVNNRFIQVLQPTAPPSTEPVEVRPIRVTEPISSLVNNRFVEVLQPTAPPSTEQPVEILEIRPIRVTEPIRTTQGIISN